MNKKEIATTPFLLFLCSIPFGEVNPIRSFPWLSLTKICFSLFLAYMLFQTIRGWRPPRDPRLIVPLIFFLGGVLLASALSGSKLISFKYFLRLLALATLSVITGWMMKREGAGEKIFKVLLILAMILSLLGIYQTLSGRTVWNLGVYGAFGEMIAIFAPDTAGEISVVRGSSAFDHPNLFGTFLVAVLPFGVAALSGARGLPRKKILFSIVICVCLIALLFTFSRSAWLGLFAGLLVMLIFRRGSWIPKVAVLLVAAFALSSVLLPAGGRIILWERSGAFPLIWLYMTGPVKIIQPYDVHRLYSYRAAWRMLYHSPLTGVGPGMFDRLYDRYKNPDEPLRQSSLHARDAHNSFLSLAAQGGLLTLLPFVYILGATFFFLCRLLLSPPAGAAGNDIRAPVSSWTLAWAITAGLAALLVQSFFNSLEYQEIFWILIGAAGGISRNAAPRPPAARQGLRRGRNCVKKNSGDFRFNSI